MRGALVLIRKLASRAGPGLVLAAGAAVAVWCLGCSGCGFLAILLGKGGGTVMGLTAIALGLVALFRLAEGPLHLGVPPFRLKGAAAGVILWVVSFAVLAGGLYLQR